MRKTLGIAFVALALLASSTVAMATPITLQLTSDHCTGLCGPQASFGSINLNDTVAGQVTVTIALNNGNLFVNTGFDGTIGFNLIGINSVTYSNISQPLNFAGLNYGPYSQFDGFGTFEYAIAPLFKNGGGAAVAGPLSFTVSAAGITAQSFLEPSVGGAPSAYFAVDILSGTTGKTGLVDASNVTVPDGGSTAALLGSVLFGVAMLRRKFGRS